jgi:glycosyltransferase involved in cell wall biosynthesis
MKKFQDKIAICLTCHNYGRFLDEAIQSVIKQTYVHWELYIFLEECTDNSNRVVRKYQFNKNIKIFRNKKKIGLIKCANKVLKITNAKYFSRLDADDFLHKDAYNVILKEFKKDQNLALVYTDYFYVDESSNVIEMNSNINKIKKDNPAHGACSVVLREKFLSLGGYNERFNAQDGYDLWINFLINKLKIKYLKKHLFYYRQHSQSLSKNTMRILAERKKINDFYSGKLKKKYRVVLIIGGYDRSNFLLKKINNKVLLKYAFEACKKISKKNVFLSTNDKKIIAFAKRSNIKIIRRPKKLDNDFTTISDILVSAKRVLNNSYDIFVFVNAFNPFVKDDLINQGINNLKLFNCDSVISVYEDLDLHYKEDVKGLKKLMKRNHSQLRIDRETLYVDARMFRVTWSSKIFLKNYCLKNKLISGKIIIPKSISLNIRSEYDFWLAEKILKSIQYKQGAIQ